MKAAKSIVQNLRGVRRVRVALPFLPALLVPLALTGVTVPSATGIGEVKERVEHERKRADRAERAGAMVRQFGDLEQLDELVAAGKVLRGMIPGPRSEIDLFNRVRFLGEQLRLGLSRTDVAEPRDMDLAIDGESVFLRELTIAGTAPLSGVVGLVAGLRQQGLPVCVLEASLSRGTPSETTFKFTMRLGVFHRAVASEARSATDAGAAEAIPGA